MSFPYEVSRQKVIYVFGIADSTHKGLLKIGDTTFTGDIEADARRRIDEYTRTLGVEYKIFHTELAKTDKGDGFRDYDVHRVLINSNIKRKKLRNAREWFEVDLDTVKKAISAVKHGENRIYGTKKDYKPEIIFRSEQEFAISRTVKHFKKHNEFLWNAKMRFGKTICALEVVRRMNFKKTIIVTHRPVVNAGWKTDFDKIFRDNSFIYVNVNSFNANNDKNCVCFASMQDLRGSEVVGGTFDKNEHIFSTNWDCVIVDEAHEGTKTPLGDNVIRKLIKNNTKLLALSGTPFNIIDDFDEEATFTWDYVDEQSAKADWYKNFPDDPNPYADLPRINIFAYDLGELFGYVEDKMFNFSEFFRTESENFVHADDVENFLNLLVKLDDNNYPFAREDWRDMFRHTLWIVPGVKEGRALSKILKNHRVFGNFEVVNVAGSGDCDDEPADALKKVENAIETHDYTITLSCGKLTTGVTVPEWTAVFMLKGGSSAMSYLQTIFRVQTPCKKRGLKENCYVFDFAPDRTLKIVADAVAVSTRAGKTTENQRQNLENFLKFCPVIAIHGSRMNNLDEKKILRELKRAYVDRVVRRGFDDNYLYNDELLNLNELEIADFDTLGKFVGSSGKKGDIVINDQGLTGETKKKTRTQREKSPEERESDRKKRQRLNAIKILRGISIRMPLLIYGADVSIDDDITIDKFVDSEFIDDESWIEFMPKGVTKEFFAKFIKFYDRDVFIAAGNRVRQRALRADSLNPADRVEKIAELFDTFKNPDKETVLTPWRVVNLHLSSLPADIFTLNKKILDINSKTGLYPLWIAQKIFKARTESLTLTIDAQRLIWDEIVAENVFVLCKTPMAVKITRRTLLGYRRGIVNARHFPNLIQKLKTDAEYFIGRITQENFWYKGAGKMFFDAVVGNPPYQIVNENTSDEQIYNYFIDAAFKLADKVSLIHPARCLFNAGKTPKEFNQRLLTNEHIKIVRYEQDSTKFFPTSDIEGGIVITFYDKNQVFGAIETFIEFIELKSVYQKVVVDNPNFKPLSKIIFAPESYHFTKKFHEDNPQAAKFLSDGHAYDLTTNIFEKLPTIFLENPADGHEYIQIYGLKNKRRFFKWIRRDWVNNPQPLTKFKVLLPKSNGSGALGKVIPTPLIGEPVVSKPLEGCTQTFITIGAFDTEFEAKSCLAYIKSKFCRAMLGILKVTQDNKSATWAKVPLQDFTAASDIDWSGDIDEQLYRKYNLTAEEINFIETHVKKMD